MQLYKKAKQGGSTPEVVKRIAEAIKRENPELSEDRAYAIAVKTAQKAGYIRKGTMELTSKGRAREASFT